uniref:hypothetical protein n=1 Tax=Petrachloros mirabilis TaxID=2918835 RepID=UPI001EE86234|nr:hypothetical protein [Petrachloros mirabilis]
MEDLVAPACERLFVARGIPVDQVSQRVKRRRQGGTLEIDVPVANQRHSHPPTPLSMPSSTLPPHSIASPPSPPTPTGCIRPSTEENAQFEIMKRCCSAKDSRGDVGTGCRASECEFCTQWHQE